MLRPGALFANRRGEENVLVKPEHEVPSGIKGEDHEESPTRPQLESGLIRELDRQLQGALDPGLYIVATPIGNLADISVRALSVLARVDVVYCEDTRHSRILLAHYGIRAPLQPYHEHNAEAQRPRILKALGEDRRVALISDAGTPLISDPGYKLVHEAIGNGHTVSAVPGASAVLAALSIAGLPTDSFYFGGFLPQRQGPRRTRIAELAQIPSTVVLFEAPGRIAEALADLAHGLGSRQAAVARELTKLHETVLRGSLEELAKTVSDVQIKGEIVIVIAPPADVAVSDDVIVARLREFLAGHSLRDAVRAVSEMLGAPKSRVYALGVKLQSGGTDE